MNFLIFFVSLYKNIKKRTILSKKCAMESLKNSLDFLCVKYRNILYNVNVYEIDTLLAVVWKNKWEKSITGHSFVKEDVEGSIVIEETRHNEILSLMSELEHIYSRLETMGVSVDDVRKAFVKIQPISRVVMRKEGLVVFPDYNKEVRLFKMLWVVYALFMRHPEGFILKEMADYKQEIISIYISSFGSKCKEVNIKRVSHMVDRMVDPTSHTVSEYISKIYRIILDVMETGMLVDPYCIKGTRGGRYKISISRNFVSWELDKV